MQIDDESVSQVMDALLQTGETERKQRFEAMRHAPEVQAAVEALEARDWEQFYYGYVLPGTEHLDGLLASLLPQSSSAQFLFKHASFVEQHFSHIIEKFEGTACSTDKARHLLDQLLRFFLAGTKVAFDRTQKYTFHLPTKVFLEHDIILAFFEGLEWLFYGRPERYLSALAEVTRQGELASKG